MNEGAVNAVFSGRVQGVGFRFTAEYLARRYKISGWVMNLPDGKVEVFAQGDMDEVDRFLVNLKNEFSSNIADVSRRKSELSPGAKRFVIRHYY